MSEHEALAAERDRDGSSGSAGEDTHVHAPDEPAVATLSPELIARARRASAPSGDASKIRRSPAIVRRDATATRSGLSKRDADTARELAASVETAARQRLCDYFHRGLGGGGAHWWRSREVRKFRAALKSAARAQAYKDFDVAVDAQDPRGKTASRDLKELIGANFVYDDAKKTVDDVLREMTDELMDDMASDSDFVSLRKTAERAARRSFRRFPGDAQEARTEAERAVAGDEARLKVRFREVKDSVTGKRDEDGNRTGSDWAMTANGTGLAEHIADEVEERGVGRKALEKAIEADSMSRGLIILGDLIDGIITGPGEMIELSIEFRIPAGTGVVVIVKLEGMASRGTDGAATAGVTVLGDPNRVELSAKFSVGAGAEAIGLSADGTLGLFIRAGSNKGSRAALQALSYGAYRAARPDALKNLWAPPDKRGEHDSKKARSAVERAETWAAAVEQDYFGEDDGAFAHVGLGVDGAVGINAGVAEFGIGFGDSIFAKYDRDSLMERGSLGDRFGTSLGKKAKHREAEAQQRRSDATAGAGFAAYLSFSAKIGAGDFQFEVSASGSGSAGPLPNWGIDLTFGVTTPSDVSEPNIADKLVNKFVAGVGEVVQKLQSGIHNDQSKANVFGKLGQLTSDGGALVDAATQQGLTDAIKGIRVDEVDKSGTDFALGGPSEDEALTKTEELVGVSSMLLFAVTFGQSDGKWVVRVELRNKKGITIGNSASIAKFSGAKTTRLFAGGKDPDGAVLEFVGRRY